MKRIYSKFKYLLSSWIFLTFVFSPYLVLSEENDTCKKPDVLIVKKSQPLSANEISVSLTELIEYREEIEKDSYNQTMKLCLIYKTYENRPISKKHYKYIVQSLGLEGDDINANLLKEKIYIATHDKVFFLATQAMKKIEWEALLIPFTTIFGLKAQFNEENNVGLFDADSWIYSLYTKYLISSQGFEDASIDCFTDSNFELNWYSEDENNKNLRNDIKNFTKSILDFEFSNGTASQLIVNTVLFGAVFKIILKVSGKLGGKHILNLFKSALKPFKNMDKTIKRVALVSFGVPIFSILGGEIVKKKKQQKNLNHTVNSELNTLKTKSLYQDLVNLTDDPCFRVKDIYIKTYYSDSNILKELIDKQKERTISDDLLIWNNNHSPERFNQILYLKMLPEMRRIISSYCSLNFPHCETIREDDRNAITQFLMQNFFVFFRKVKLLRVLDLFKKSSELCSILNSHTESNPADIENCKYSRILLFSYLRSNISPNDYKFLLLDLKSLKEKDSHTDLFTKEKVYYEILKENLFIIERLYKGFPSYENFEENLSLIENFNNESS